MGRSIPTDEPAVSYPSLTADISLRLQQLVNGWRGAERGEPLTALHNACVNAVRPGGRHLVPINLLLVQDLDVTDLQIALRNLNGRGQGTTLRFRVRPMGRFDAVLVPTRSAGDVADRWLLAIEEKLSIQDHDRLYGPDLAQKLEWREAGDVLHSMWTPEVVVLRIAGHDVEVQREESRLVDPQTLKALRGGIGETYRQSIQAILSEKTEGLSFAQVVWALSERQGHDVHRGTVRTLLYAGGFVQRNDRWFAAPQNEGGARKLRAALVETLEPVERGEEVGEESTEGERERKRVRAIRERLGEVVNILRENLLEKGKIADDN